MINLHQYVHDGSATPGACVNMIFSAYDFNTFAQALHLRYGNISVYDNVSVNGKEPSECVPSTAS